MLYLGLAASPVCGRQRLPLVWGSARAKAVPSAPCNRVGAFLTPKPIAPPLCENVLCLTLSFVIGRGVTGRKAQAGKHSEGVRMTAGTFWKRGGASRRLQMQSSPAGLPASSGMELP